MKNNENRDRISNLRNQKNTSKDLLIKRGLLWSLLALVSAVGTVNSHPKESLDEYLKTLDPTTTIRHYKVLQDKYQEETALKENPDTFIRDTQDELAEQFKIVAEVVADLAHEEIITENKLIFAIAILSFVIPNLIDYLFVILITKAKLTTASLNLISNTIEQVELLIISLTKILTGITTIKSQAEINADNFLKKSKPNQSIGTKYQSKIKWLFTEIQVLRRVLTQVKLACQLPIFYSHQRNFSYAYNSLVDFANPRFSHLLRTEVLNTENDSTTLFHFLKLENTSAESWENIMLGLSRNLKQNQGVIINLANRLKVNLDFNNSVTTNSEHYASLENSKIQAKDGDQGKNQANLDVINETYIGNAERIQGFYEYYSIDGIIKLKVFFEIIKTLLNSVQSGELSVDVLTPFDKGQTSLPAQSKSIYVEKINESLSEVLNQASQLVDESDSTKAVPNIQTIKWSKLAQAIASLSHNHLPSELILLLNIAKLLDDNKLFVNLFTNDTINKNSHFTGWQDALETVKMPSQASQYSEIFDPAFLNFLIHFRLSADLSSLINQGQNLNLEQEINKLFNNNIIIQLTNLLDQNSSHDFQSKISNYFTNLLQLTSINSPPKEPQSRQSNQLIL